MDEEIILHTNEIEDQSTWRIIRGEEFIQICNGKYKDDIRYQQFYKRTDTHNEIIIEKIIVNDPILFFGNQHTGCTIQILSGQFNREIVLSDGVYHNAIQINGGYYEDIVKIEGGAFNCPLTIFNGKFASGLSIAPTIFKNEFEIQGGTFLFLTISSGTFEDNLRIKNGTFHGLIIHSGFFNKKVVISGGEFINGASISGATFQNSLDIGGGNFPTHLSIGGGVFNNGFFIAGKINSKLTIISNAKFHGNFQITGGQLFDLQIRNATFYTNINFNGGNIDNELTFYDNQFERIIFEQRNHKKISKLRVNKIIFKQNTTSIINILSGTVNEIRFENSIATKDSIIQINDIAVNKIMFKAYTNLGYINFNSVKAQAQKGTSAPRAEASVISFINSSLGKMEFINCDLDSFKYFEFEGTNIQNVTFSNTKMPKTIQVREKRYAEKTYRYEQEQYGYAQLKKIFQSQGDNVTAIDYYANEMTAYRNSLPQSQIPIPSWLQKYRRWPDENYHKIPEMVRTLPEQVALIMNFASNDFGRSWIRALFFVITISAIFFTAYCLSIGFHVDLSWVGFHRFLSLITYGFEFTLPTHRSDFMFTHFSELVENGWSRTWDFLGRIFITYGLYQIVQAFRKHGKSTGS